MRVYVVSMLLDNGVERASHIKNECVVSNIDDILPKLAAEYPGGEVKRSDCEHLHYTLHLNGEETDFVFLVEEFDL